MSQSLRIKNFANAILAVVPASARILEIGCGEGQLTSALRDTGCDVTAIDPKQRAPFEVICSTFEAFDAPPRSFDCIAVQLVLHHVESVDAFLEKAHRLLRPDGVLAIDDYGWERAEGDSLAQWRAERSGLHTSTTMLEALRARYKEMYYTDHAHVDDDDGDDRMTFTFDRVAFTFIGRPTGPRRTSEKWKTFPAAVLPLFVAEMDFALAPAVSRALHDAVERSDTGYAWPHDLRAIFSSYAKTSFDWNVPAERVFIVNDVMGGVTETLRSLTAPNDGVVIMPPVYPPFFEIVGTAERRIVEVPLLFENGNYAIDWPGLERAFAGGAKALLLCNPHNPVGRVFARSELTRLAMLAQDYRVLVISDEIHAALVYSGNKHVPFVAVAEPYGIDCVTLMSASKGWNIAGLKCAQMIAGSERVRQRFNQLPRDVTDRVGHFGVIATAAAYTDRSTWLLDTMSQLDANRRLLAVLLFEHLPEIGYRIPDATYLAWLDCRNLHRGDDPAQFFLDRGNVALSHGPDFGSPGRGFARLNFATAPEVLDRAVRRMAESIHATPT